MERLRFLTFNIHGGRTLRGGGNIGRVHELLERLDVDIAVLQEVDTRPSRGCSPADIDRLVGRDRPHRLIGITLQEEGGWYGNLIASRYPILRGLVHNLETKPAFEPRNAVDALIDTPIGKLRVIGTHLSLSYHERRSEAKNLLRLMRAVEEEESLPLFLLGDINEWQWRSSLIDFLNASMTPLPCRATFPALLPVFRLDRAWYDIGDGKPAQVFAHRLALPGLRHISDHLPLIVELDRS